MHIMQKFALYMVAFEFVVGSVLFVLSGFNLLVIAVMIMSLAFAGLLYRYVTIALRMRPGENDNTTKPGNLNDR